MDLSTLRKGNSIAQLQKKLEDTAGKKSGVDTRFWKPTKVKKGGETISSAVIRLLPISKADYKKVEDGEFTEDKLSPYLLFKKHYFQGPNGWYIENSLNNIDKPCPVYNMDKAKWTKQKATGDETLKSVLMKRTPRKQNICNILVVKDPEAPVNEGKVFLWDIPSSIMKLVEEQANPKFDGIDPIDVFNPDSGCNLILNLTYEPRNLYGKTVDCPVWTSVKWAAQAPIGDDEKIERVWSESYSLLDFIANGTHKTYDELEEKLKQVMGLDDFGQPTANSVDKTVAPELSNKSDEPSYNTSNGKDFSKLFGSDDADDDIPF